jgi:hypothetical protein
VTAAEADLREPGRMLAGSVWLEKDRIGVRCARSDEAVGAFEGLVGGNRKFCGCLTPAAEVVENERRPRGPRPRCETIPGSSARVPAGPGRWPMSARHAGCRG